ncbi:mediator of RNA polymerase II transcription subunit 13 [Pyrus ussuriensis x Pyrus communis]|uniref:Mediator of RNA polymerase II transcription subunit 13 n=1 Tax=Pyrus ussuriensis x Pyrus communis TaxID=2448454 RepID=A0A5N5GA80_9ROSA|nr:mediator of RNA polymerase II transcription subunit 13 [Pyrus ussuriensis x Pyrus communis]
MEVDSGRWPSPGFVLLDCPQATKIESRNASLLGSIGDYFLSLSNGWDLTSYLKSLSEALKALKLGHCLSTNAKEGSSGPSTVIYVVCPFPEPIAVLKTVVESSVAIGSVIFQSGREKRSLLHSQGEIDASLRTGGWDSSWQTRSGAVSCDPNRIDIFPQDETSYMFEPLFILVEPGSLERALSPLAFGNLSLESSKPLSDDSSGGFLPNASLGGNADSGSGSQDGSEPDKTPSLHCCYGWTEDWRWLICIWTDSRGELLDSHIFPFGGISSRQDTKGLECLFVQVLQRGCQILQACSSDTSVAKPRDFVIARIGSFYELEYQGAQGVVGVGSSAYLEGFTPVKSLGSKPASYILIPSPSMRFLPPTPLQLPTCLTAESPPSPSPSQSKEEWPSSLLVSLIDHYGGNSFSQDKLMRGNTKQAGRSPSSEARELEFEIHVILESLAAELHALSWMTVSPVYLERQTALPFHCDMVLRLRRLLHFADKKLSRQQEKA